MLEYIYIYIYIYTLTYICKPIQVSVVPIAKHLRNLIIAELEHVTHHMVALADNLHVTILNAVVDHLDIVTCASIADPLAAW